MKKLIILLATILALCASPAYAAEIPPLPHAFYGSLTINGDPAAAETVVEARGAGVITNTGNPLTTEKAGEYGGASPLKQRLIVQGFIPDGAEITFYVNDISTEQAAPFQTGETTRLDLSVTTEPEPEPEPEPTPTPTAGGGGGGPSYTQCQTNFCGDTGRFSIDYRGKVVQTVTASCKDRPLTITIDKGTMAEDKKGKPLSSLSLTEVATPPPLPEGANIIGLPLDLEPDRATFDPPLTFTWTYDPKDVPEGVAPEDLVLAYYDEDTQSWVELECTVDTDAKTVTAKVSHFTTFALMHPIPKPEAPAPPTPPAPTPPAPPPKPEPAPLPPVPVEPEKVPPPAPAPTPPAPTPAPPEAFNWLWVVIAGMVVALVIVVVLLKRQRRRY